MNSFAEAWPEEPISQQPVAKLRWGQNVRLLDLANTPEEHLCHARQAIQHDWSRNLLALHIESDSY
ncbi:MAG: hypothetical protein JNL98_34975 [Bryobacterales bacterium]|nr:hypothetical protein [Bryobacterales bacterium]